MSMSVLGEQHRCCLTHGVFCGPGAGAAMGTSQFQAHQLLFRKNGICLVLAGEAGFMPRELQGRHAACTRPQQREARIRVFVGVSLWCSFGLFRRRWEQRQEEYCP